MEELKAKLEQVKKDFKIAADVAGVAIADLEQQIADSEATYSIGDRFKDGMGMKLILIAVTGCSNRKCWVMLARLKDGHGIRSTVEDWNRISPDEINLQDYTRYWDARKQEKC